MTKEETAAKELIDKFRNKYKWVETDYNVDLYRDAKQCALICIDEILIALKFTNDSKWYVEQSQISEKIKEAIQKA